MFLNLFTSPFFVRQVVVIYWYPQHRGKEKRGQILDKVPKLLGEI